MKYEQSLTKLQIILNGDWPDHLGRDEIKELIQSVVSEQRSKLVSPKPVRGLSPALLRSMQKGDTSDEAKSIMKLQEAVYGVDADYKPIDRG